MSSIQRMSKISHCRQKKMESAKKAASSHMKVWWKFDWSLNKFDVIIWKIDMMLLIMICQAE